MTAVDACSSAQTMESNSRCFDAWKFGIGEQTSMFERWHSAEGSVLRHVRATRCTKPAPAVNVRGSTQEANQSFIQVWQERLRRTGKRQVEVHSRTYVSLIFSSNGGIGYWAGLLEFRHGVKCSHHLCKARGTASRDYVAIQCTGTRVDDDGATITIC